MLTHFISRQIKVEAIGSDSVEVSFRMESGPPVIAFLLRADEATKLANALLSESAVAVASVGNEVPHL